MQQSLINKYLPQFTFNEYHATWMNASIKDCFIAAKSMDIGKSFLTKTLMNLRGLPTTDLTLQGFIKNIGFTYLEENLYNEFVIDASQKNIKIIWNFYFEAIKENKTLVSTETRILCLTKRSKSLFQLYWLVVKPFSGLTRLEMLRLIRKNVEIKKIQK
ncbi:MAG TPA: hypothetical protein VGP55_06420 [Chitinophagaceae bacterium]|nr:hypothetical protein [Chitinophagaceae bacterium]